MPGKPLSDEPAIEGPARTKAKARIKLMVRIMSGSGIAGESRRFRWQVDNQRLFPEICAEAGNGFVAPENCFVGIVATKHSFEKSNDFK